VKIAEVEGVGEAFAGKLNAAGIQTTEDLLAASANPKGRKSLAESTGIDEGKILEWANRCDLMRIKGVGSEYSDLLESAGVDTVKELATRRADNLTEKMAEVNATSRLVRRVPTLSEVESWIAEAKTLPPALTY
jgi:predicted flap endonuclease-1-like 5' DNA nuclease